MKDIEIKINYQFMTLDELDGEDRMLVETAIKATNNSNAKYSHFCVGAALLLEDGSVVVGANQENAVFPLGLCAERTAIFAAQAQTPQLAMKKLAVAARNEQGLVRNPVSPCGSCRQVMLEMEDRYKQPMKVLLYGTDGVFVVDSARDLLPLCFLDESMK